MGIETHAQNAVDVDGINKKKNAANMFPAPLGSGVTHADIKKLLSQKDKDNTRADELMHNLNELIGLDKVKAAMTELRAMVDFDFFRKIWFGDKGSLLGQSFHMR